MQIKHENCLLKTATGGRRNILPNSLLSPHPIEMQQKILQPANHLLLSTPRTLQRVNN